MGAHGPAPHRFVSECMGRLRVLACSYVPEDVLVKKDQRQGDDPVEADDRRDHRHRMLHLRGHRPVPCLRRLRPLPPPPPRGVERRELPRELSPPISFARFSSYRWRRDIGAVERQLVLGRLLVAARARGPQLLIRVRELRRRQRRHRAHGSRSGPPFPRNGATRGRNVAKSSSFSSASSSSSFLLLSALTSSLLFLVNPPSIRPQSALNSLRNRVLVRAFSRHFAKCSKWRRIRPLRRRRRMRRLRGRQAEQQRRRCVLGRRGRGSGREREREGGGERTERGSRSRWNEEGEGERGRRVGRGADRGSGSRWDEDRRRSAGGEGQGGGGGLERGGGL